MWSESRCFSALAAVVLLGISALSLKAVPIPRPAGNLQVIDADCAILDEEPVQVMIEFVRQLSLQGSEEAVPEEVGGWKRPSFEEIREGLALCRAAVEAVPSSPSPPEVQAVARQLGLAEQAVATALEVFDNAKRLRKSLASLSERLAAVGREPIRREEWPPADLCARCQSGWIAMVDLRQLLSESRVYGSPAADPDLVAAFTSLTRLRRERRELCRAAKLVLEIDVGAMDVDFGYFSLTTTRLSFHEMEASIRRSELDRRCQGL